MNREEIIKNGQFFPKIEKEPLSVFRTELFVPLFDKDVKIEAFNLPDIESSSIQLDLMIDIINEIVEFDLSNAGWIKEKIWEHFNIYMEDSSYGMVNYNSVFSAEEANRDFFGIADKEAAYKKAHLDFIHFDLDQTDYRHFNLSFSCPWEDEHGITICVINGEFEYMD